VGTSGRRAGRNCAGGAPSASVPSSALCSAMQPSNSHRPHLLEPAAYIVYGPTRHELSLALKTLCRPDETCPWAAAVQNGRT
jgi:hypothetical protein